jgi:hypothetical protein
MGKLLPFKQSLWGRIKRRVKKEKRLADAYINKILGDEPPPPKKKVKKDETF